MSKFDFFQYSSGCMASINSDKYGFSVQKYIFREQMSSVLTPWLPIYPCVFAIRCPFLYMFHWEKI